MPIARRAIECHGGSLAIESEGGCGTTALVTLPAGTAIADSHRVADSSGTFIEWLER